MQVESIDDALTSEEDELQARQVAMEDAAASELLTTLMQLLVQLDDLSAASSVVHAVTAAEEQPLGAVQATAKYRAQAAELEREVDESDAERDSTRATENKMTEQCQ